MILQGTEVKFRFKCDLNITKKIYRKKHETRQKRLIGSWRAFPQLHVGLNPMELKLEKKTCDTDANLKTGNPFNI